MTSVPTSVVAMFLLSSSVLAQAPPTVHQGTWTASIGASRMLRGVWSAQALVGKPDSVIGSWALLNDTRQVTMEGTWSAEKSARGWQGTWSARVVIGRSAQGRSSYGAPITGTWQTETPGASVRTFADLLRQTLEKEVAGSWRRGPLAGYWWLKGSAR